VAVVVRRRVLRRPPLVTLRNPARRSTAAGTPSATNASALTSTFRPAGL
jgi:hypothetical protein